MNTPALLAVLVASALTTSAHPPELVRLWETPATLKVPEGVLLDSERQVLYVSNIEGTEPWGKDGAGSIGKVGLDGTVQEVQWVTGLNAPKGMARHGKSLYVADLTQVVVIDLDAGRITRRLDVPEAQRLNDVTADKEGNVYVTDSQTGHVHRIKDGKVSIFSRAFKGPNGILAHDGNLFVLDQEALHRLKPDGTAEKIAEGIKGHVDGVEALADGFLVTCWEGMIYHVAADRTVSLLKDTREQKANAADPAFDAEKRILYVPTFWKNTVVAYQVQ